MLSYVIIPSPVPVERVVDIIVAKLLSSYYHIITIVSKSQDTRGLFQ